MSSLPMVDQATRSRCTRGNRRFVPAVIVSLLIFLLIPTATANPLINDFTIVLTSQNVMWVDANKCSVEGPRGAWLSFWITNDTAAPLSDVLVEFNGFTGTNASFFSAATDNTRDLGTVPGGGREAVYFYVDYAEVCNNSQGGGNPYTGFTADYTLVVKVGGVANTTFQGTITTDELITATAAGVVVSELLIPEEGVWVGMILDQLVTYSFNNNRDLFFQPAAEAGMDDCLRLVNVIPEYVDPGITGIPLEPDNRLWYPDADVNPSQTELGNIEVRYQWEVLCYNNALTVSPWAAAKSGQPYKYQSIGAPIPIQPAQPSLDVAKVGERCVPDTVPQQTYTVIFTNTVGVSNVPVFLKRIEDSFSGSCVSLVDPFATGSEVNTINSSAWPTTTQPSLSPYVWDSNYNGFGAGNDNVKGWRIESTGDTDLALKFTVDFSACPAVSQTRYTNTVTGFLGEDPPGEVEVTSVLDVFYPCTTLAVTMADFRAEAQSDHVLISWETVSELDNLGFNLYRSESPNAPGQQINAGLIPSQAPGSAQGALYTWQDYDVIAGATYHYWLEDVDLNGATTLHGPVSVTYQAPSAVTLGDLVADSAATPWSGLLAVAALVALGLAAVLLLVWRPSKQQS